VVSAKRLSEGGGEERTRKKKAVVEGKLPPRKRGSKKKLEFWGKREKRRGGKLAVMDHERIVRQLAALNNSFSGGEVEGKTRSPRNMIKGDGS